MNTSVKNLQNNDVNGNMNFAASSGRGTHSSQVNPDRQSATVHNNTSPIRIATWNVRSMHQNGKLENVLMEMERLKINICGISEMRWTGTGKAQQKGYTVFYSGGEKHERGVGFIIDKQHAKAVKGYRAISDRILHIKMNAKPFDLNLLQVYAPTINSDETEIDDFYKELNDALRHCRTQENTIILGDFNAKVGGDKFEDIVGPWGLGICNERGEKLIEWAKLNDFMIGNTWFKNHERRRWTWNSPGGNFKNQIDFILIRKRFRNAMKSCKAYPGADCGSDHNPVITNIQLKLKKLRKGKCIKKLNTKLLQTNLKVKSDFKVKVQHKYENYPSGNTIEEYWNQLKSAISSAANETIPPLQKEMKKKWMTKEIMELMTQRRKSKGHEEAYRKLNKQIRTKCDKAKEEWLTKQCEEIEQYWKTDSVNMHKKIRELSGKRTGSVNGCIKSEDGVIITEKKEMLKEWTQYIAKLYNSDRSDSYTLQSKLEGPAILKEEVQEAITKITHGKSTGPDDISIEMVQALGEWGLDKITQLINRIYESGTLPEDFCKSIFVALPKKPGAIECGQFRTISLMSHVLKILLRVIMNRIRNKIRAEISEEQSGFMKDKGTRNSTYILRTLLERAIEFQQDVYICFIDYTKAFDNVKHDRMVKMLEAIQVDGKDLRIITNIYWNQTAAIRWENEIGEFVKIKKGVRQGCVLSPDLFNLYSEQVMRHLEEIPGIKIGGKNINNLRYADDTALIARSEKDLQILVNKIKSESEKVGLYLNLKKTVTMVISKKLQSPKCSITLNNTVLAQVEKFKYLGTVITSDGRSLTEIKQRIGQAKTAFKQLGNILRNQQISFQVRYRVLEAYVLPILTYCSEAWTINRKVEDSINATEMWFIRRMQRISYTAKVTNENVLKKCGTKRTLLKKIRSRQTTFFGHVIRKEGLENLATTGKFLGKRSRGRQREKIITGIGKWLKFGVH